MNIKFVHTQNNGWIRVYINGEYIGKDIRMTKDIFNDDITINIEQVIGTEIINDYNSKDITEQIAEYKIQR